MDSKLKDYLAQHKVDFIEHHHEAVFTVEEAKTLKQRIPGLHCKCLFLKDENENFYLIALPAEKRLDMKKLRTELNVRKLTFGSPDELKQHLNLTPGSVSIFGMIYAKEVVLILDREVWNADRSGFHPNINTSTLEISHQGLESFYNSLSGEKKIISL